MKPPNVPSPIATRPIRSRRYDPDLGDTAAARLTTLLRTRGSSGFLVLVGLVVLAYRFTTDKDPGRAGGGGCGQSLGSLLPWDLFSTARRETLQTCLTMPDVRWFLLRDLVLIAAYGLFLAVAVQWLLLWMLPEAQAATWLIVGVVVGADLLEDAAMAMIGWLGPSLVFTLVLAASNMVKWLGLIVVGLSAVGTVLLAVGIGLGRSLHRTFTRPGTTTVPAPGASTQIPGEADPSGDVANAPADCQADAAGPLRWYVNGARKRFDPGLYGIGLSGGGIRSAAFCLGAVEGLTGPAALNNAQYLATVSGGGYLGVSSQFIRHAGEQSPPPYSVGAPEVGFVSRHHRYLGTGILGGLRLLIVWVYGLIFNAFVVVGLCLAAGVVLGSVGRRWEVSFTQAPVTSWSLLSAVPVALLGAAEFCWLRGIPRYNADAGQAEKKSGRNDVAWRFAARTLMTGGVVAAVVWVPLRATVNHQEGHWHVPWWLVFAVGSLVAAVVCWLLSRIDAISEGASVGINVCFAALLLVGSIYLMQAAATHDPFNPKDAVREHWWWAVLAAVFVIVMTVFDQTYYSPHGFYKRRIADTFALARSDVGVRPTAVSRLDPNELTSLDRWAAPRGGPQLLVCATANSIDVSLPPAGIRASPFVFSHDYVGSPELGHFTTAGFIHALGRKLAPDGTLQAATAISGAAVASALGKLGRIRALGSLLALTNIRLGVWLPNPRWSKSEQWLEMPVERKWRRIRRPSWLLREVVGGGTAERKFIYVSDGGHLDNLGLLELLRRRCSRILVIDASEDPPFTTQVLTGVLQLAEDHLGVTIKPDMPGQPFAAVAPQADDNLCGVPRSTCSVATYTIDYPTDLQQPRGKLIFAKATFAEDLQNDTDAQIAAALVAADTDAGMWRSGLVPKVSTVNQFMTDAQFAALHRLGQAVGARAASCLP